MEKKHIKMMMNGSSYNEREQHIPRLMGMRQASSYRDERASFMIQGSSYREIWGEGGNNHPQTASFMRQGSSYGDNWREEGNPRVFRMMQGSSYGDNWREEVKPHVTGTRMVESAAYPFEVVERMRQPAALEYNADNVRDFPALSNARRMEHASTYPDDKPVVYANVGDDIDVCLKCFKTMSNAVKASLRLQPICSWKDRGHPADRINCDICQTQQSDTSSTTKLDIAIKLYNSGLEPGQIALACSRFEYNGSISQFCNQLQDAGYNNRSATELSELIFNE
jgi:hypothetical protein